MANPVDNDKGKTISPAGLDAVVPFQVSPLDIRGRAIQLGPLLDDILHRHNYPECVSTLLAEAITLTILLGTSIKLEGKFIVQTQTDGPVSMLLVDFRTPGSVRAYARFDKERVAKAKETGKTDAISLMGDGILAMTIDQGAHTQRYQGIVKLEESSLEDVARQYFKQSEQIPTEVRLAVAQSLTRSKHGKPDHGWQAGGLMVQFLPESEERLKQADLHGGDDPSGKMPAEFREDDAWVETRSLMSTIDDVELVDRDVNVETLLYRLFNEHGVRVFEPRPVKDECSCSIDTVKSILASFSPAEITESVVDGKIEVNCEFCSTSYHFDVGEFID